MKALQAVRAFVQRIVALFRPRRTLPRVEPLAVKEDQPAPAAAASFASFEVAGQQFDPAPEIAPPDTYPGKAPEKLNRKARRAMSAYERARRKHDVFVEPKGTPPVKKEREQIERDKEEQQPVEIEYIKTEEFYVADKHHRDPDGPDVLFKETEFYGEYNFRDTILEQLERYFVYLKRMKAYDPDSYGFYRQVGAHIIPYESTPYARAVMRIKKGGVLHKDRDYDKKPELPPFFNKHRPSFGCFAFGANPVGEEYETEASKRETPENMKKDQWVVIPKFMYFTKYTNPPPEVQPMSGGDVYKMTLWWDRPQDARAFKKYKGGKPTEYAIFISADGSRLEVLRMVETKRIEVLIKKKRRDADGRINFYHQIPQRLWRIPDDYEEWAKYHGTDAQHFLQHLFCDCAQRMETINYSMVRIAATRDNMTAVFSVNIRRMAYFFKDRDFQLTQKGARKPIFHIVRAHERHTKDGKTYYMPFSFRGEREFTWAGYDISITVPGRDHFLMPELDIGVSDAYWQEKGENWISEPEFGKELVQWIKEGRGGRQ